jgi:hypothetical protein
MYPSGNGDVDCPICGGRGVVTLKVKGPPQTRRCDCVLRQALIDNMNRAWFGLSKVKPVKESPLLKHIEQNVWVTGGENALKQHLLSVGLRQKADWYFKVVSDADLITAWLGSMSIKGAEIFDPDVSTVSSRHMNLVDLIEPPELLIIRLGVKKARNQAMGEVLWETLQHRIHINKPVWLVDSNDDPLTPSHICWIEGIQGLLIQLKHITLERTKSDFDLEMVGTTETKPQIQSRVRTKPTPKVDNSVYIQESKDEDGFGSMLDELMENESKDSKKKPKKKNGWRNKR